MEEDKISLFKKGNMLPVMESFYTIQGEGYYKGHAAYFIRLGGCDVGCHWCDVKESWEAGGHAAKTLEDIVSTVSKGSKIVVITGGEPLMWNTSPLTEALKKRKIRTHLETSGAYDLSGVWDWICLSPKKQRPAKSHIQEVCNELKIIVHNKSDLKFAEEQAAMVNKKCILYLQPEWGKRDQVTPEIVDYVLQNPKWQITLQSHKYMNVP